MNERQALLLCILGRNKVLHIAAKNDLECVIMCVILIKPNEMQSNHPKSVLQLEVNPGLSKVCQPLFDRYKNP